MRNCVACNDSQMKHDMTFASSLIDVAVVSLIISQHASLQHMVVRAPCCCSAAHTHADVYVPATFASPHPADDRYTGFQTVRFRWLRLQYG